MRNSKAKQIRRELRAQGIGVGHTHYEAFNVKNHEIKGFDSKGEEIVVGTYQTYTAQLKPDCGRKLYKESKANA
jgi:hypothetical protein